MIDESKIDSAVAHLNSLGHPLYAKLLDDMRRERDASAGAAEFYRRFADLDVQIIRSFAFTLNNLADHRDLLGAEFDIPLRTRPTPPEVTP